VENTNLSQKFLQKNCMIAEKMFNATIDLDEDVFQKSDEGEIKLYSVKLFDGSIMKFTVKVLSPRKVEVKYILTNIKNSELDKFKQLTNNDIKNIIYNSLLGNPVKSIYEKYE